MLGSRQADRSDVIREHDRAVHLHQGDVIVIIVLVVVRVGDDPLQVFDYDGISNISLGVKAEVSFPCPRLWESDDTQEQQFIMNQVKN